MRSTFSELSTISLIIIVVVNGKLRIALLTVRRQSILSSHAFRHQPMLSSFSASQAV